MSNPVSPIEYVGVTDTARLIRKRLKAEWPDVKFSVRSSKYAGGASIDVRYFDGPPSRDVKRVVGPYCGSGFDGMIDLSYSVYSWLYPDGVATFARTAGTTGNAGTVPGDRADPIGPDARLVLFLADHVFVHRRLSRSKLDALLRDFEAEFGPCAKEVIGSDEFGWRANFVEYHDSRQFWQFCGEGQ